MPLIKDVTLINSNGGFIFDDWIIKSVTPKRGDEVGPLMRILSSKAILLLEGGADISPALYGEENRYSSPAPHRDVWEQHLYMYAREYNIPVFGICRGHQLMAALNGGTLFQDMRKDGATHYHSYGPARLEGIMKEWYPEGTLDINSMHHQAVKFVPSNAVVVARNASDDIIEALDYPEDRMFSVQWHPEIMGDVELLRHIVAHLTRG